MQAASVTSGTKNAKSQTNRWARGYEVSGGAAPAPSADFIAHLEHRLSIDSETALALLGEWLVGYEPGARARFESRP